MMAQRGRRTLHSICATRQDPPRPLRASPGLAPFCTIHSAPPRARHSSPPSLCRSLRWYGPPTRRWRRSLRWPTAGWTSRRRGRSVARRRRGRTWSAHTAPTGRSALRRLLPLLRAAAAVAAVAAAAVAAAAVAAVAAAPQRRQRRRARARARSARAAACLSVCAVGCLEQSALGAPASMVVPSGFRSTSARSQCTSIAIPRSLRRWERSIN